MQDEPSAVELFEAIREFIEQEIVPTITDPRTRFRTLVAVNAVGILEREVREEDQHVGEEARSLRALLGSDDPLPDDYQGLRRHILAQNAELAARIRRGQAPPGTADHLRRVGEAKLAVANPGFLRRYPL